MLEKELIQISVHLPIMKWVIRNMHKFKLRLFRICALSLYQKVTYPCFPWLIKTRHLHNIRLVFQTSIKNCRLLIIVQTHLQFLLAIPDKVLLYDRGWCSTTMLEDIKESHCRPSVPWFAAGYLLYLPHIYRI